MRIDSFALPLSVCVLIAFAGSIHETKAAGPKTVDAAVRQAIPFLRTQGAEWIEQRGCVSCHQVPAMLWSLSTAQEHGFDVDPDQLKSWQSWSTQVVNFVGPDQKSNVDAVKTLAANIDTMNGLLLAIPGNEGDVGKGSESWRKDFVAALVENQQPDGSWKACGQLPAQKRSKEETTQVTVLWSLLALAQQNATEHNHDAAIKFVTNDHPVSTEWWTVRLLLSYTMSDGQVERLRTGLLGLQQEDGGWGWLSEEASDALATGMAMYALQRTGGLEGDSLDRAERFLISTQREDGSWSVPGTKQSSRNKSTATSDYWGTAWAVIGLLADVE